MLKNGKNSNLFTPGGQNITLSNESHEIQKIVTPSNVIGTNMNIKNGPEVHSGGPSCRPTTDLPNSAEFGCSEQNESCSKGYPELIHSDGGIKIGPEAHSGRLKAHH